MAESTKMVHIRMPASLIKDLDRVLEKSANVKTRTDFIIEATRERLKKEEFKRFLETYAGTLSELDAPHWKCAESIDVWQTDLRKKDEEVLRSKWQDQDT